MTPKEFRAAVFADIVAWAATNFPTLPVIYENGPVPDEDKIGQIWLDVEVRWYGGMVAAFGEVPRLRQSGAVSANCFYRAGEGTEKTDDIVDSFDARFQARRIGAAVLLAPQRTVPTNLRGWYKTGTLVPFTLG